ncbi:PH domain-containing protein [Thermaerobacillus caldiproteolyticus]|uniref:Putative membrane protein YdbT with pleckstrin-like domain n=1 Tax=Thermaerobacillus caldiproteolyticus TaxID=247480 RepID=A0A7V9Z721_9BACL|nr:PH domain-containing protein [Anoxybacillus caldiproteolyticus]MBA2875128.1 putative membrane protein YdbT with pleckstrin-like domain [Anoxybacillus caldiproteolyticus]
MYFPSKKDIWMAIIIWLSIFVFIIPPIFAIEPIGVIMLPSILNNKLITMIIMIVPALLLSWIWFDTGYKIEESKIMVKSGPYRKTINIKEISSVRTTKNPFAAPALSMDKIEINYGNFEIVTISPKNKDEFIYQLQKRNPEIQIDNHF